MVAIKGATKVVHQLKFILMWKKTMCIIWIFYKQYVQPHNKFLSKIDALECHNLVSMEIVWETLSKKHLSSLPEFFRDAHKLCV